MLLASCLLLDHLKLHAYASMIRRAILSTVTETRVRPIARLEWIQSKWSALGWAEKYILIFLVFSTQWWLCYIENILLTLFFPLFASSPSPAAHCWPGRPRLHLWSGPVHHECGSEHRASDPERLEQTHKYANYVFYAISYEQKRVVW